MEWSTEQPTAEGIYWAAKLAKTIPASNEWDIDLVNVEWKYPKIGYKALGWDMPDNELECLRLADENPYDLDYYTHWQGPIMKPAPPWGII